MYTIHGVSMNSVRPQVKLCHRHICVLHVVWVIVCLLFVVLCYVMSEKGRRKTVRTLLFTLL